VARFLSRTAIIPTMKVRIYGATSFSMRVRSKAHHGLEREGHDPFTAALSTAAQEA
jgi:hypothetical protein